MKISDFVDPDAIEVNLKAKTKSEVLEELVESIVATGKVKDSDKILAAVIEREKLCSTGFENGVAIPHPRQGHPDVVEELVAGFGRAGDGIDFDALDGEPVYLFFLLCAPSDSEHLKALAKLSRFLKKKSCRERLMAAQSPEDILTIIEEEEE
ncbi:MAG: PTS sugar transporter subunit IIA [bacterium]|nr:PTS sugar transporter subunit IIA [bacterium]